ncbi:MAG: hypothetical protein ACRC2S_02790 [Waterburya sp.]
MNIATYHRLGGVSGALQKHVDEIYHQLSKETSTKVGKKAMQRVGRVPRLEATASRS